MRIFSNTSWLISFFTFQVLFFTSTTSLKAQNEIDDLEDISNVRLSNIKGFEIRVKSLEKSKNFYLKLLGGKVFYESDNLVLIYYKSGQYISLSNADPHLNSSITQLGFSINESINILELSNYLRKIGLREIEPPLTIFSGLDIKSSFWIASENKLIISDERGLIFNISNIESCYFDTAQDICNDSKSVSGLFEVKEINHFTAFVNDGKGATDWWQKNFGLNVQAMQGPNSAVNGIGHGTQFLMFAGPFPGGESSPPKIHHASFNIIGDFSEVNIVNKLKDNGFVEQGNNTLAPMMFYVSRRMPERGGVEGGTPEIYFTDPDGILLQIQSSTYCGGGGILGDICLD